MPFARPTLTELRNQAIEDITTSGVPGLTGLLRNAVLRVLAWCMAGLAYSVYGYADWIARMGVPFTAEDEYLYAWAALVGVYPEPATPASGQAHFTGTPGTILPLGTPLNTLSGATYETTADGTVDSAGSVVAPMTATINGGFTNVGPGTQIFISELSVAGINSSGLTVGFAIGGADAETQAALRTRMLLRYRAPPQGGAESDYVLWALQVPGCSRAWCYPMGAGAGTVIVFPMFDIAEAANGGFPIGTNGVSIDEVRPPQNNAVSSGDQGLVADHIYPLQPVTAMVYVVAPVPHPINVTIVNLVPDSNQMRQQIIASIDDMLLFEGEPGGVIYPSQLYDAILATAGIEHFTMTVPSLPVEMIASALPITGALTVQNA